MKITRALERVLRKALVEGKVHVVGGFNDGKSNGVTDAKLDPVATKNFDTKAQIEKALGAGLFRFGDAWNTYHPTEKGRAAIAALDEARRVKAEVLTAKLEAREKRAAAAATRGKPA